MSAQAITLSVPAAITSPAVASQVMSPRLRIGWPGGRGGRSMSPAAGLLYPSPMDWIVTVVKATHKICSGRSGSPPAMLKMLAPRKEMMKPNMQPISNRMYRARLSYSPRPSSTALMIVEKLSSVRIMTAASLATSVPVMPIAIPMSAFFSAGASLTPSPVMATISPLRWSTSTRRTLCSGLTRAITPTSPIAPSRLVVAHRPELRPADDRAVDAELAGDRRRGDRVIAGDHADPDPGGPGPRDRSPGGGARRVDDPDEGEQLQIGHEREQLGPGIEGGRVEVPARGGHDPQALFPEPLVLGQVQLAETAVERSGPVSGSSTVAARARS